MRPADRSAEPDPALAEEIVRLRSELEHVTRMRARRTRGIATAALVLLTTLGVIAGTVSYWAHRTVFDEDRYMEVVGPLGEDPAVTSALSHYLSDQIVTALDLERRIREALADVPQVPERALVLAAPIADAADDLVRKRVDEFVASQEFRTLWVEMNRVGHAKVVALLRGDDEQLPNVEVGDAEVRLNLLPIASGVLHRLVQDGVGRVAPGVTVPDLTVTDIPESARQRLGEVLGVSLPPDFGEVTIMTRQKLDQMRAAMHTFDRMVWGLIVLSILLGAATLVVAVNKRRALVQLGVGVVVGLVLGNVAIRRVKEAVVDRIDSGDGKGAARAVMDDTLASLRDVGIAVVVVALVIAVVAHLVGPPRWLTGSARWVRRQTTAPDTRQRIAENADGLRIAVIALGLLALFFTGVGVLSVLFVGGLVALCLWMVERVRRTAAPESSGETGVDEVPRPTGRRSGP